jgi:DNA modification methylase
MVTGTTAVASKELKRSWIGFEIQSTYIEVSNKRI